MKIRDRIVELRRVKASELVPNPRNWRKHPKAQADALRGVLAEVGYADALLARQLPGGGLMLVDGHLRAETTPDAEVPVLVLDVTEAEADKILLTLDPLAAMAEADADALSSLLAGFETDSEAVRKMLSDLSDEAGIERPVVDAPEARIDEAEELRKKWGVERGQLWVIGKHRLLCGDSTSAEDVGRLMGGERINVAVTSPPYASQREYDESSGFKPIPPDEYVDWYKAVADNIAKHLAPDGSYFCNIKEHCEDGQRHLYVKDLTLAHVRQWKWRFVDEFCWKRNSVPGGWNNRFKNAWEPIFHFCMNSSIKFRPDPVSVETDSAFIYSPDNPKSKTGFFSNRGRPDIAKPGMARPSNVLEIGAENKLTDVHSAPFPVALPEFFVLAFSDDGDVIYDPFMGAGTTIIAAEKNGRRGYGMELSPKYVAVALQRLADMGLTPERADG